MAVFWEERAYFLSFLIISGKVFSLAISAVLSAIERRSSCVAVAGDVGWWGFRDID